MNRLYNEFPADAARIQQKIDLQDAEMEQWKKTAAQMYLPKDDALKIVLQQDGFLDKTLEHVSSLDPAERPINQHWSWDRILRSPYIKQADVLQGMYFFEDHFSNEELERNYAFYEPFTVHESSLSPCVHAILASKLGKEEQAYAFYLRTARLDLDDYNAEVEEGLHITSMAGTWMSIVEGFAGMRIKGEQLSFAPRLPKAWEKLQFKINFRDAIYTLELTQDTLVCSVDQSEETTLFVHDTAYTLRDKVEIAL